MFSCFFQVLYPEDISKTTDENFKRWEYKTYNFTISVFWSPYLVRTQRTEPNDVTRPFNLYLDEPDPSWTTQIEPFDYVIISAGHWFSRPTTFYMKRHVIGCLYCPQTNITHKTSSFSYQKAFRTAFKAINGLKNYKGVTLLRTFVPSHFENGSWDKGGDCTRTRPFKKYEIVWEDYVLEMHRIQVKELGVAKKIDRKRGLKFILMDMTQAMLLRPDGHPSKYGHWPHENATTNDCVHWCLPGPIDTWNDFLLEIMKREEWKKNHLLSQVNFQFDLHFNCQFFFLFLLILLEFRSRFDHFLIIFFNSFVESSKCKKIQNSPILQINSTLTQCDSESHNS